MMLDWTESEKQMLAEEAKHLKSIQEIPGLNPDVVAAMVSLYRTGWRDCWIVEMRSQRNKDTSNVH
jgi:hypothetical protein